MKMISISCDEDDLNNAVYEMVINTLVNLELQRTKEAPELAFSLRTDVNIHNDNLYVIVMGIKYVDDVGTQQTILEVNEYNCLSDVGCVAEHNHVNVSDVKLLLTKYFTALGWLA